jgi:toxin ParE1/3/4
MRSGSHVIYYRKSDIDIDIIRILHQRMDVSRHLP